MSNPATSMLPLPAPALGDQNVLAYCLAAVLERDPGAEPESPKWSSFISA